MDISFLTGNTGRIISPMIAREPFLQQHKWIRFFRARENMSGWLWELHPGARPGFILSLLQIARIARIMEAPILNLHSGLNTMQQKPADKML